MPAPAIAPASWATTYGAMSFAGMRPAVNRPIVTAGLKCPPETWPTAEAIVNTERPKANETPSSPMPTCGNAAASTALPQPPKTSQSVPRNSADNLCVKLNSFMLHLFRISSRALVRRPNGVSTIYVSGWVGHPSRILDPTRSRGWY